MDTISVLALNIAVSQIGEQEHPRGSNWGNPVKDYLLTVGINFPASWCLAFIYWCFQKAAKELQVENNLIRTGGVLHEWNFIEKKYKSTTPQKASIFIMDLGHGLGHCGIVETVENAESVWLHTIEGNTNDTGSREGYEVCRKMRNALKCKGFINM